MESKNFIFFGDIRGSGRSQAPCQIPAGNWRAKMNDRGAEEVDGSAVSTLRQEMEIADLLLARALLLPQRLRVRGRQTEEG